MTLPCIAAMSPPRRCGVIAMWCPGAATSLAWRSHIDVPLRMYPAQIVSVLCRRVAAVGHMSVRQRRDVVCGVCVVLHLVQLVQRFLVRSEVHPPLLPRALQILTDSC